MNCRPDRLVEFGGRGSGVRAQGLTEQRERSPRQASVLQVQHGQAAADAQGAGHEGRRVVQQRCVAGVQVLQAAGLQDTGDSSDRTCCPVSSEDTRQRRPGEGGSLAPGMMGWPRWREGEEPGVEGAGPARGHPPCASCVRPPASPGCRCAC